MACLFFVIAVVACAYTSMTSASPLSFDGKATNLTARTTHTGTITPIDYNDSGTTACGEGPSPTAMAISISQKVWSPDQCYRDVFISRPGTSHSVIAQVVDNCGCYGSEYDLLASPLVLEGLGASDESTLRVEWHYT